MAENMCFLPLASYACSALLAPAARHAPLFEMMSAMNAPKPDALAPARPMKMTALPSELLHIVRLFLDAARPVARLFACSRWLKAELSDDAGRLRAFYVEMRSLWAAEECLAKLSLSTVNEIRVDLSGDRRDNLDTQRVSRFVTNLGSSLSATASLKVLSVCLAPFDANLERLRLGCEAWTALGRGFCALSKSGTLRNLQLTHCCTIKQTTSLQAVSCDSCLGAEAAVTEQAPSSGRQLRRTQSDPSPGAGAAAAAARGPSTFADAVAKLTTLNTLILTHDEVRAQTALELASCCKAMPSLALLDLTRNHIPPSAMKEVREALPTGVELRGSDRQTYCW